MQKPKRTRQLSAGFSLVEVMFALFLIVLVIGIASQVAGNSVRNANSLKESTFARWVALNQLDLYQMSANAGKAEGSGSGEEEMGGIPWRWVREVNPSSSEILLEVKVVVYHGGDSTDEEPVATVKGYVSAAVQ